MSTLANHQSHLVFAGFVAKSPVSLAVCETIRRLAKGVLPVIVSGDVGTGKTTVGHLLHTLGPRVNRPIRSVQCPTLREGMNEGELFGLGRGFGTSSPMKGLMEIADGSSLLLENIEALPRGMQARLVHYLEYKEVQRVGQSVAVPVDVRLVATTSVNLDTSAGAGFSPELLFRLNAGRIDLPPLRERTEDMAPLIDYFLATLSESERKPRPHISTEVLGALESYRWPGNLRELHALLQRAVAMGHVAISLESLPNIPGTRLGPASLPSEGIDLSAHINAVERELIRQALERADGNQTRAAQLLRLTFRQFRYRLERFDLGPNQPTPSPREDQTDAK
jgi:DNA-binding NtrC family response regulator